jgi:hypothetical protein
MSKTTETIPGILPERSTPTLKLVLRDENKLPIPLAQMTSIKLTGLVRGTEAIINARNKIETKNDNGGTYGATDGLWQFPLGPDDMAVQDQNRRTETHIWLVEWYPAGGKQNRKRYIMHVGNMEKVP